MTGAVLAGVAVACLAVATYIPGLQGQTRMHFSIGAAVLGATAVLAAVAGYSQ